MNRILFISALIAAFTAIVHIFAGGADVVSPLLSSTLASEPKHTLYAVWHMVSVVLVFSTIALFVGSLPRHVQAASYLVIFISMLWLVFGIVFLVVVAIQSESGWLFKLPQWVLLLPVGFLGLWGNATSLRQRRNVMHDTKL